MSVGTYPNNKPTRAISIGILLLTLFAVLASSSFVHGSAAVVDLTSSNFDRTVLQSEGIWMVAFVAPWCGHCKSLHPEYDKAAESLGGVVNMGRINCDDEKELAQRYGIRGFPTIKIFGAGKDYKKSPDDYQYQRTAGAIVNTLLEKFRALPDPVKRLSTPDQLNQFLSDDSSVRAVLISSKDSNPNLFKSIAVELRSNNNVKLAFVPQSSLQTMKDAIAVVVPDSGEWINKIKAPALLLYPEGKSVASSEPLFYEGKMKKDQILKFVSSHVAGTDVHKEKVRAEKKAEEEKRKNQVVVEKISNIEDLKKYCDRMCILAVLDETSVQEQRQLVNELAQQYAKKEKLKFATYEGSDAQLVKDTFEIEELVSAELTVPLVVLRAGKNKYSTNNVSRSNASHYFERVRGGLKFNSYEDFKKPAHDEL